MSIIFLEGEKVQVTLEVMGFAADPFCSVESENQKLGNEFLYTTVSIPGMESIHPLIPGQTSYFVAQKHRF